MQGLVAFASVILTAVLLLTPLAALAQIRPGEYVSGGGFGVLRIAPGKGDALRFQLNARGANFHTCELSGVLRKGEARMEESADDKQPCIVTFKPEKNGIVVASKYNRACSSYCGARAHFEAEYLSPPAGCAPSQIGQIRNRFKAAYDKKAFAEARTLLAPIIENCTAVLTEFDDGWIRNDLALAQHRAGDSAACRTTLKPWLELAQTPDETIRGDYPPSDAEAMLRIARATRTNMKLCGAPVAVGVKSKN